MGQGRAVVEHVVVAMVSECCRWQGWSLCQVCAAEEHAIVAAVSKCRCWQSWSLNQGRATLEHAVVAIVSKCCRWQSQTTAVRYTLAVVEKSVEAIRTDRFHLAKLWSK